MKGNTVLVRQELLDRALLDALADILDPRLLEAAVDRALARLRTGLAHPLGRRAEIERALTDVEAKETRLVAAITAAGSDLDPLVAALRAAGDRKGTLRAELAGLADVSRVATLDAEQIKLALRTRVADVRSLLAESTHQARAMLRKILDGPIDCQPIHQDGRQGFRFRGRLTFKRVLTGDLLGSLTGRNGGDTHRQASWLEVPFEGLALAA